MKNLLRRLIRDERGDMEDIPGWTILAVGTLVIISLVILGGRVTTAHNTVQAAAHAAARDASLSRTEATAIAHGTEAAYNALDGYGCASLDVVITGNGLTTGLGEAGIVTATITCTVPTGDLVVPGIGIPGEFTITKVGNSPVDPYRER
ncbi:MAG: hypothetical protein ACTH07_08870 [Microbacterium sp.]|uniref:hypothetical protein n=1 Tax=Microbacterium sp. TaxID=51671 RepID=UPI003F9503DB